VDGDGVAVGEVVGVSEVDGGGDLVVVGGVVNADHDFSAVGEGGREHAVQPIHFGPSSGSVFVDAVFEAAVNGDEVETALIPAVRHRAVEVASSLPVGDDASPDHASTATMILPPTHWTAPAAGDGVVGVGAVLTHRVLPIAGCPRPTSNHRQALG
jgi:hypothetical protein